jgi:hypothetical protein
MSIFRVNPSIVLALCIVLLIVAMDGQRHGEAGFRRRRAQ